MGSSPWRACPQVTGREAGAVFQRAWWRALLSALRAPAAGQGRLTLRPTRQVNRRGATASAATAAPPPPPQPPPPPHPPRQPQPPAPEPPRRLPTEALNLVQGMLATARARGHGPCLLTWRANLQVNRRGVAASAATAA